MNRIAVLLPVAVAAAAVLAAAPSSGAATGTFVLKAGTAGEIKSIASGSPLTFVFTAFNQTGRSANEDLVVKRTSNLNVTALTCVSPDGGAGSADGHWCEPDPVKAGQQASLVVNTDPSGPGNSTASVRVCLINEDTGATGPCKTVRPTLVRS